MAKIGRNDPCPCGSGKKYKNCCLGKPVATDPPGPAPDGPTLDQGPPTLHGEVEKIQRNALDKQEVLWTMGVFVFFSTREGDGWVLDASAMDALQVAEGGRPIAVDITQTAESIEITWSHTFVIEKNFTVTTYLDKRPTAYKSYPASRIRELISQVRNSLSPEMLASLNVS